MSMPSKSELQNLLMDFYSQHDPDKLAYGVDIAGIVEWTLSNSINQLQELLKQTYGVGIDLNKKFAPSQSAMHMSMALPQKSVAILGDPKRNELTLKIQDFYSKYAPDKLANGLEKFVEFALYHGIDKLNEKLIPKYGEGVPHGPYKPAKGAPVREVSATPPPPPIEAVDEDELMVRLAAYYEKHDPEKASALQAIAQWGASIGVDILDSKLLQIYGEGLYDFEVGPPPPPPTDRYSDESDEMPDLDYHGGGGGFGGNTPSAPQRVTPALKAKPPLPGRSGSSNSLMSGYSNKPTSPMNRRPSAGNPPRKPQAPAPRQAPVVPQFRQPSPTSAGQGNNWGGGGGGGGGSSNDVVNRSNGEESCGNYKLDMTGATFGACVCGFPRADHKSKNAAGGGRRAPGGNAGFGGGGGGGGGQKPKFPSQYGTGNNAQVKPKPPQPRQQPQMMRQNTNQSQQSQSSYAPRPQQPAPRPQAPAPRQQPQMMRQNSQQSQSSYASHQPQQPQYQQQPQQQAAASGGGACNSYQLDMVGGAFGDCVCGQPRSAHGAAKKAPGGGGRKPSRAQAPAPSPMQHQQQQHQQQPKKWGQQQQQQQQQPQQQQGGWGGQQQQQQQPQQQQQGGWGGQHQQQQQQGGGGGNDGLRRQLDALRAQEEAIRRRLNQGGNQNNYSSQQGGYGYSAVNPQFQGASDDENEGQQRRSLAHRVSDKARQMFNGGR